MIEKLNVIIVFELRLLLDVDEFVKFNSQIPSTIAVLKLYLPAILSLFVILGRVGVFTISS